MERKSSGVDLLSGTAAWKTSPQMVDKLFLLATRRHAKPQEC
jgi:hypothetical protein